MASQFEPTKTFSGLHINQVANYIIMYIYAMQLIWENKETIDLANNREPFDK